MTDLKAKPTYRVQRANRKTIAMGFQDDLSLLVKAPQWMKDSDIDDFVKSHARWIARTRDKLMARKAQPALTASQIQALYDKGRRVLAERVPHYAALMGFQPTKLSVTGAQKRWGSCSAKGSLCFSYRLFQYPDAAIDYVIVHELAHLRYLNHSAAFYKLIAGVLPDYKQREKLLKGLPPPFPSTNHQTLFTTGQ